MKARKFEDFSISRFRDSLFSSNLMLLFVFVGDPLEAFQLFEGTS
jgi:hypothetical protein